MSGQRIATRIALVVVVVVVGAALGTQLIGKGSGAGSSLGPDAITRAGGHQHQDLMFTRPSNETEEIALALEALPESMRSAASVYVMGEAGYRMAREGTNGVSCLVQHSRPDTQEPICWDREGSETILPTVLDESAWRAAGIDDEEIARRVAEGFSSGTYRAPRRPGLSYMLSAGNYVFNGERVVQYHPHVMSYAPYLTNADIGSDGTDPGAPWILEEGSPHAYIIIPMR